MHTLPQTATKSRKTPLQVVLRNGVWTSSCLTSWKLQTALQSMWGTTSLTNWITEAAEIQISDKNVVAGCEPGSKRTFANKSVGSQKSERTRIFWQTQSKKYTRERETPGCGEDICCWSARTNLQRCEKSFASVCFFTPPRRVETVAGYIQ